MTQAKLKNVLKILKLEKPKASASAYLFFAKENRKAVTEDNKENNFTDISKILSKMWSELPEEEKEYYEELSLYDKCRFKEEKKQYRQQFYQRLAKAIHDGTIQPNQLELSMLPSTKQTRSPYMYFSRHMRAMLKARGEYDKAQVIAKPLSIMWNALNTNQRIPFIAMNRDDVERTREERLQNHEITTFLSNQ